MALIVRRAGSLRSLLPDTVLRIVALLVIAGAVMVLLAQPGLRRRFDATRTRAYSLSEQSRQLLERLDGDWRLCVVLGAQSADGAVRTQVDEVLRRYEESGRIRIQRIDPADAASIPAYETLLNGLRMRDRDRIARADGAIARAAERFDALVALARELAVQVALALGRLPETSALRAEGAPHVPALDLLAARSDELRAEVRRALGDDALRPVPDWETARSVLAGVLLHYAEELDALASFLRGWRGAVPAELAALADREAGRADAMADACARDAEALRDLVLPELAAMSAAFERGDFAIVLAPDRAALVSPDQLFPALTVDEGEGRVAFDRRFRGEQVLSGAIRSLLVPRMPLVVFVHAEERSLLRANEQRADLVGARSLLEAARFEVREWIIGDGQARPVAAPEQSVVWIVLPPPDRRGLEPSRREMMLVEQVGTLLEAGESVLMGVYPSLLPRYRRRDPWTLPTTPLGVRPETDRVIWEVVETGGGDRAASQNWQAIDRTAADHPIARAVDGQQVVVTFPVPIALSAEAPPGVARTILLDIAPGARRWLERDWVRHQRAAAAGLGARADERGDPLPGPVAVAVAVERSRPGRRQRVIVVGSGGWLHSYALDAVVDLGGGQVALTNPGNQELLLAGVQWLAEMDDHIAPSPISRQVARLEHIDGTVRLRWALAATVVAPALLLAAGWIGWLVRRRWA